MAFLSASCFSAGYLAQAARGQYTLLRSARPIGEVIRDEETPAPTRRLLEVVQTIKAYGKSRGLTPTKSYERYADLHRPAAAWIVQACAPLSFDVKRWSFPLVGSVPYLGFFDEAGARRYASSLFANGALDVDVRTASAYSTLGWFADPVLSTMLRKGDDALGALVDVVLHESVHATVYVKDQSAFNESLASFVADRLTSSWLSSTLGSDSPEARAWLAAQARDAAVVARLHRTYLELDALYRSDESAEAKLAEKKRILAAVGEELHLKRPLNNAQLAGYRAYNTGAAAFEQLFTACGEQWPQLLKATATLAESDFSRPQQEDFEEVIARLAREGCAGAARARKIASSL